MINKIFQKGRTGRFGTLHSGRIRSALDSYPDTLKESIKWVAKETAVAKPIIIKKNLGEKQQPMLGFSSFKTRTWVSKRPFLLFFSRVRF
jgi:hypothetical protein